MDADRPFHAWSQNSGTDWLRLYRTNGGYRLSFPTLADFYVSSDGCDVKLLEAATDVPEPTIRSLLLNQVMPLALSRQGELVLHAGAVEMGMGVSAFLGRSGFGKSTLTASFARGGHRFLTDDGLQLERSADQYLVRPSHPSIRLWEDSLEALIPETVPLDLPATYTSKSRALADVSLPHCDEPRQLQIAYFLGDGTAASTQISPMRPGEAMIEFVRHSFLLDIQEREAVSRHFAQLSDLVGKVATFRLDYPREFAQLQAVRGAIVAHARSLFMGQIESR
jgi:hypothetical protein